MTLKAMIKSARLIDENNGKIEVLWYLVDDTEPAVPVAQGNEIVTVGADDTPGTIAATLRANVIAKAKRVRQARLVHTALLGSLDQLVDL